VLAEIELYLDNEIADGRRCEEIRVHLEVCPPCTDRAEFQAGLKELIAKKCGCADVPDSIVRRIAESLGTESAP
jgi:mycothiol system anti-sigma-R factor